MKRPFVLSATVVLASTVLLVACDRSGTPQATTETGALAVAPAAPAKDMSGKALLPSAPAVPDEFADSKTEEQASILLPPSGALAWDWVGGSEKADAQAKLVVLSSQGVSDEQMAAYKAGGVYTVCAVKAQKGDKLAEMTTRFNVCQVQGFDAVTVSGMFAESQGVVNKGVVSKAALLADAAHNAGLAVFQQGGEAYASEHDANGRVLADVFDGALTENCQQRHVCGDLLPYFRSGKPVLNVETKKAVSAEGQTQLRNLGVNTLWR